MHVLAVGHATSVSTAVISGLTWFWVILAAAAGARFGWLAPIGIFVLYLLLHSGTAHGAIHVSGYLLPWVLIGAACGFVGWQLGGRGMLRHVGEREYLNRLIAAKGVSSIWKRWLSDGE